MSFEGKELCDDTMTPMQGVGFGHGVWKQSTSRVDRSFIYGLCMYSLMFYQVLDHWEDLYAPLINTPRYILTLCVFAQHPAPDRNATTLWKSTAFLLWQFGAMVEQNKKQGNKDSYS